MEGKDLNTPITLKSSSIYSVDASSHSQVSTTINLKITTNSTVTKQNPLPPPPTVNVAKIRTTSKLTNESYDNLNDESATNADLSMNESDLQITCPISNFEQGHDDEIVVDETPILKKSNKQLSSSSAPDMATVDFQIKVNTETFLIASDPAAAISSAESAFNLSGISFNKSEEFEEDGELRDYDEEMPQGSESQLVNEEDEFFLISTPSPFNLAALATARTGHTPQSFRMIEQDDDEQTVVIAEENKFLDENRNPYVYQLDANRLSNITEEEDDENRSLLREPHSPQQTIQIIPKQVATPASIITATTTNSNIIYHNEAKHPTTMTVNANHRCPAQSRNDILRDQQVQSYNEMLKLSEDCSKRYACIELELSKPTANYVPVMKKRVYHLNGAYLNKNNITTTTTNNNNNNTPSTRNDQVDETTANIDNSDRSNSTIYACNLKHEEPKSNSNYKKNNEDDSSDSILNYLIGRLSEQHKTKLDLVSAPKQRQPLLDLNDDDPMSTEARINQDFDEFEQRLFQKYVLSKPMPVPKFSDETSSEFDLLHPDRMPKKETSYILTKSVFANHKKIKLADDAVDQSPSSTAAAMAKNQSISSNVASQNNKLITALSINEIEMRKSFTGSFDDVAASQTLDESHLNSSSNAINVTSSNDVSSLCDERNIKEEIVLIGEKTDIESLLENQNNQLFNLILSNSNQSKLVADVESDLSEKRLTQVQQQLQQIKRRVSESDDIEIEIHYEEKECEIGQGVIKTHEEYETELRQVAKYLVDEITKISLNKVKIDSLNATLDKKYSGGIFGVGEMSASRGELLNNLAELLPADGQVRSREQLLEYYTKLENNLEQVRNEIEQLKREAFEDMAYINQILGKLSSIFISTFFILHVRQSNTKQKFFTRCLF